MSDKISYTLTGRQISDLGILWKEDLTPLSPLDFQSNYPEGKNYPDYFLKEGICDESGSVWDSFKEILEVFALPTSYVNIVFLSDTKENNISKYYSDSLSRSITMLEGEDDSFAVGASLKTSWITSAYGLDTGANEIEIKPLAIELNIKEAVVFLALCDLERELFLVSKIPDYSNDKFLSGFGKEAIKKVFSDVIEIPGYSLFSEVFRILMTDDAFKSDVSDEALNSLSKKGIIRDMGNSYHLNPLYRESVVKYLVPDVALDITHLKTVENDRVLEKRISGIVSKDSFYSVMKSSDYPEKVSLFWLKRSDAFLLTDGLLKNPKTDPESLFKADLQKSDNSDAESKFENVVEAKEDIGIKDETEAAEVLKVEESKEFKDTNDSTEVLEAEDDIKATEAVVVLDDQKSGQFQTSEKKDSGKKKNFCPECGSPLKEGAKFCSECGNKIA